MPAQHIEFHFVNRITIGTVGEPGSRIFLMQVSDAIDSVTLKLEKEQAKALAATAKQMLENLNQDQPITFSNADYPTLADLEIQEPSDPLFVIGQMGLGYDRERNMIVLAAQELVFEAETEPSTARFWISRPQLEALSKHTTVIVEQGRPSPTSNGYYRQPL